MLGKSRKQDTNALSAFTVSAQANESTSKRASFSTSVGKNHALTLDDIEEFAEEKRRAEQDARARTIGNGLLIATFAVQLIKSWWTGRRRKKEAAAERAARETEVAVEVASDKAENDAGDEDTAA